jgi:DegV family protein with EDD domain
MAVRVVTESQTCLPPDIAGKLDIVILPFTLELDGRVCRDGVDISHKEFYRMLPTLKAPAKTAAISPGVFLETFEHLAPSSEGILVVTIAKEMSATYNNAQLAANSFDRVPVEVLDSQTAAMAQGFAVMEAAKAARDGHSLYECYEIASDTAKRAELLAYIATFEYLKRSGRVNGVKALAATALSIKPVFSFKDGDAVLKAKKHSTAKAREYIAEETERFYRKRGPLQLAIFHADAEEEGRDLERMILDRIRVREEVIFTEFTPVMGSHTGPGVVGASFL